MWRSPRDLAYRVMVEPSPRRGGYIATVPAFPRLMTAAVSPEDAVKHAVLAIQRTVSELKAEGRAPPEPDAEESFSGQFRVRVPRWMHARLVRLAEKDKVSLNTLLLVIVAEELGRREGRTVSRRRIREALPPRAVTRRG